MQEWDFYEVKKFLLLTPRRNMFLPAVLGTSVFDSDIPNFNSGFKARLYLLISFIH